jgi:hypothetical protein
LAQHDPNALTLDTDQGQLGDEDWGESLHVSDAHGVVANDG